MKRKLHQYVSMLMLVIAFCILFSGCANSESRKYEKAKSYLAKGQYEKAVDLFSEIGNYEDANRYVMYIKAINLADNGDYLPAISAFKSLKDFGDSYERMIYYSARYYEDTLNFESAQKYYNVIPTFLDSSERAKQIPILQKKTYDMALELYDEYRFDEAKEIFTALGDYADSSHMFYQCELRLIDQEAYEEGCSLYKSKHFEEAIEYFKFCKDYRDSVDMVATCEEAIKDRDYNKAISLFAEKKFDEALKMFSELGNYLDSRDRVKECKDAIREFAYTTALECLKTEKYNQACDLLMSVGNYKDAEILLTTNEHLIASTKTKDYRSAGNTILFGRWEDYGLKDSNNELEWIVLDYDIASDKAILMTEYSICKKSHVTIGQYLCWEESQIREWLSTTFYESAFNDDERKCIIEQSLSTPGYGDHTSEQITKDNVFILSKKELLEYSDSLEHVDTYLASEYYFDMNTWKRVVSAQRKEWWLRDAIEIGIEIGRWRNAACVYGGLSSIYNVDASGYAGVRPVVCLDVGAYSALFEETLIENGEE